MRFSVSTIDHVPDSMRHIESEVRGWGLSRTNTMEVLTVCSELMYNMAVHASGGSIEATHRKGEVHVTAVDKGQGIDSLHDAFTDGWSSGRSLGIGLSGVLRICDELFLTTSELGTQIRVVMGVRS